MTTSPSSSPLRIGLLSPHNPYDRRAFSGTVFYAAEALRQNPGVELKIIGGHRPPTHLDQMLRKPTATLTSVDAKDVNGVDAVIGMVASQLIDPIQNQIHVPYVHVTDATPSFLRECYGWNIPQDIETRETRVAQAASAVVYSSSEMVVRARADLDIEAQSIPFGVNLDSEKLPVIPAKKPSLNRVNLLFVGNDWARKGGDIAVETLNALLALGVNAKLTVVGRLPEAHKSHDAITVTGYLNKNRRAHAAKLARLYTQSHLLLLPSRADCTPMVAAEAMAYGTPVLASDTGGIATLLGGPGTGRILPLSADATDWARSVCAITADRAAYEMLSDACFDRAHNLLNWSAWSKDILTLLDSLNVGRKDEQRRRLEPVAA